MANSKKKEMFNSPNSQFFFVKILGIGPWVSLINWCKGHQCGSTYLVVNCQAVQHKDNLLLKMFFLCFEPFFEPTSDTCFLKFSQKDWELGELKISFCWVSHFDYFFQKNFFCNTPMKISQNSMLCIIIRYTVYFTMGLWNL